MPGVSVQPGSAKGNAGGIDRSQFASEMSNPKMMEHLYALTMSEAGNTRDSKKAFMETVYNRATYQKQTIEQGTRSNYYQALRGGGYNRAAAAMNDKTRAELKSIHDEVMAGSNRSNFALHNSSAGVASNAVRNHAWAENIGGETYSTKGGAPGDPNEAKDVNKDFQELPTRHK